MFDAFAFLTRPRAAPRRFRRLAIRTNPFLATWRRSLTPSQLAVSDYIIHRQQHNPFLLGDHRYATYDTAYAHAASVLRNNCPGPCPSPRRRGSRHP